MNSVLVIARKFNDVFYALSIDECRNAEYKILVIVTSNNQNSSFPLTNKFDEVHYIHSSTNSIYGLFRQSLRIRKLKFQKCSIAIFSNPTLIINQLLIRYFKVDKTVFIEDGLMNYYNFKPSDSTLKRLTQFFLGINQKVFLDKISSTYLLSPKDGCFYFGEKKKLLIDSSIVEGMNLPNLEGKKIFVGQNMYLPCYGVCSVEEYNYMVNSIIKKYKIDYYLPHTAFSQQEKIECPILNLDKYHVTLEYCAAHYNFEVYSYNSSILYTTKLINPQIKSYAIDFPFLNRQEYPEILKENCDKIYNY